MITINLLSIKKKPPKKVTELQQHLVLAVLILALISTGMWYYSGILQTKIDNLTRRKAEAEARIRQQESMLREVKSVEDERRKVAEKIGVIEQLKKNQTMLVHLLDDLSNTLPKGVNITALSENGFRVSVAGTAFTNHDIVRFIDNLKACPSMSDVYLQETVQGQQEGFEIYSYRLQFIFKGV